MSIDSLLTAANGAVPKNALKPHNCHEAVLGWLLMAKFPVLCHVDPLSQGVEKAWLTLRSLADRYGEAIPKQLTGKWFGQKLYHAGGVRLTNPSDTVAVGDVIYMGNPTVPHHSMVVVEVNGPKARARGFNNAGAFGGPFMQWDPELRDIRDATRWTGNEYKCINGLAQLHRINYATITSHIPDITSDVMNF
jgi:hypothetical protein